MATTPENSALNVRTASRRVAASLGVDPAALTYDQRVAYNHALAAEILKYPASFTPQTLLAAENIVNRNYGSMTEASFDWSDFAAAVADEAKVTLPSIGNKLLLAAVALAAVFLLVTFGPPASKK